MFENILLLTSDISRTLHRTWNKQALKKHLLQNEYNIRSVTLKGSFETIYFYTHKPKWVTKFMFSFRLGRIQYLEAQWKWHIEMPGGFISNLFLFRNPN